MNRERHLLSTQEVFFGRQGTVRNVLNGIRSGASFCISGGPLIGKTALLHHLMDRLRQEVFPEPHSSFLPVILSSRDLVGGKVRNIADLFYFQLDTAYPKGLGWNRLILCLDDCEELANPDGTHVLNQLLAPSGKVLVGRPWSILWSGGERWYQNYLKNRWRFPHPLRLVPLSVLTEKETRESCRAFLGASRTTDRLVGVLRERTGGHPYLLKTVLTCWKNDPQQSLEKVLDQCRPDWEAWAGRCLEALQGDGEKGKQIRNILEFLIDLKKPVNPSEVGRVTGLPDVKPYLDTLCRMGLSDRTLREGEATVQAGCGFFNDWYKRIVNDIKEC